MKRLLLPVIISCLVIITIGQQPIIVVTTERANIRETPSVTSRVVGTAQRGDRLTTSANQGNWYYVTRGNLRGWVHHTIVQKSPKKKFNFDEFEAELLGNKRPSVGEKVDKWVPAVYTRGDEDELLIVHINNTRIIRNGNLVEFWTKDTPVWNEPPQAYKMKQFYADCTKRLLDTKMVISYDKDGKVLSFKEHLNSSPSSVVPESIGEQLLMKVCSTAK